MSKTKSQTKSVLLSDEDRRGLLSVLLEDGGGVAALGRLAGRLQTSPHSIARWIAGFGGPIAIYRTRVSKLLASRKGGA